MTADRRALHQPLALVIGCGGIAMACARRLGEQHRLILVDRDQATADLAVETLNAEGMTSYGLRCDISEPAEVVSLTSKILRFGKLRSVAHVVGLAPSSGNSRAILRVNATGAALVANAVLPLLERQAAAVFISSLGGHIVPAPPKIIDILNDPLAADFLERLEAGAGTDFNVSTAYAWSKISLMRMCVRLAPIWGQAGARINSLSPGLIDSPMGLREFEHEPRKYALLDKIPLGRQGHVDEVANAVEFLCSQRASYISGTDLLIDGGVAAVLRTATA